jgi:hypothetical protein
MHTSKMRTSSLIREFAKGWNMYPISWPWARVLSRLGVPLVVKIYVRFDKDACVFVGGSHDIPGLVVEADTLDELVREAIDLIPDMLAAEHKKMGAPISTRLSYTAPLPC